MIFLLISFTAYRLFLYCWMAVAVIVFCVLMRITAPYGRHTSAKWGSAINNKYGWMIMESVVLITLFVFIFPFINTISLPSWVMIGLFCLHYINRSFIFPFRLNTKGKTMPLLIVGSAVFFNLVNGFSLGYYFAHFAHYTVAWFTGVRFIIGTLLFFTGLYINWKADNILIHLRKPGETHYVSPKKWLFDYISCPNLFGELVEWLGFALLCWNLPSLCFLIWTAANLVPRAISHHNWYKEKFSDYPSERFAIIPFVV